MTANLFDIRGRLALVTGASRGLGYALARGLADAGANLVLHGRGGETLEKAQREIEEATGVAVATVSFDVADSTAVGDGIAHLLAEHVVPDILVNNAGIQRRAPFN